jgi:molybdopterin synthase sulfur carrier subunit
VATLRLFASAREAAGTAVESFEGGTVDEVLQAASARFGSRFADVLSISRVWVNGEEALATRVVGRDDEIAVLPPVSGG